jgi:hypothetical protein
VYPEVERLGSVVVVLVLLEGDAVGVLVVFVVVGSAKSPAGWRRVATIGKV